MSTPANGNFGDMLGNFMKDEFMRNITKAREEQNSREAAVEREVDSDGADEVVARVQHDDELSRRFYLDFALRTIIDVNNAEGMNYDWKDIVTLSEKVRAYVEAGAFIDTSTAWKNVVKVLNDDPYETLGNS